MPFEVCKLIKDGWKQAGMKPSAGFEIVRSSGDGKTNKI